MRGCRAGHVGVGSYGAVDVGCKGTGQRDAVLRGWGYTLQGYGALECRAMGLGM